jgi:hypothetical protein
MLNSKRYTTMKNVYILLVMIALSALTSKGFAQCKPDECVAKVNGGYTFLKSYQIQISATGGKVEYSYVFSKETNYMLMMCNGGTNQSTIVTLYDSNRKLIATNYDKVNNKVFPAIVYSCKATGIYYMTFSFLDKPECGVSVLAFKK